VPAWILGLAALAGLAVVIAMYRRVIGVPIRDRVILGSLRALAILLVFACLMRPTIVLSSAVAQRNLLAVLLDDSRSMRLADVDNSTRLAAEQKLLSDSSEIVKKLSERFALRFFRFGADAHPSTGTAGLTGSGTRTDIASALNSTREELAGLPLSGVIVMTDGADNGGSDLSASLLALRARRVPVYSIGVGQERFARDIAIASVAVPPTILAGANTIIEAVISLRGVHGEKTVVTVEANGRIVSTQETTLPEKGDVTRVRLRIPAMAPGTYRLAVKAKPLDKETVTENNEYHTVVEIRPGPARILYVEGEPRPEFAFLRRAVQTDSALQVVGLMRSADKKFLRLGVRDSLELVTGFPTTKEELFQYRAIILGSIEASFFSGDQVRMISDFVNLRGGGLLALGGRAAFAEGEFTGTPIADVLPLALDRSKNDTGATPLTLKIHPTPAGIGHAALQLRDHDAASTARWDSLPPLTSVNNFGSPRSGATVLLMGRDVNTKTDIPVLTFQRYGRGVSAILGVQDSWLWRMDTSISADDPTYATFWRQMLRWLVEAVPDQVDIVAVPSRVGPGESVTLRAHVNDSTFGDV
ncbi:MAG: glutamine amidotransferase, partial [Gemmatimonadaceae bacterium]